MAFAYQFCFLASLCVAVGAENVVDRVASLNEKARSPSIKAADKFAANHTDPVYFMLINRAIEANRCLEQCELHPCERTNPSTGKCTKKRKYCDPICFYMSDGLCKKIPWGCYNKLTKISIGDGNSGPVIVSAADPFLYTWAEDRLGVCKTCLRRVFAKSQIVADLVTACEEIKTYHDASRLFYDLELVPDPDILTVPRLRMLFHRYPRAQRVLSTAQSIRNSDFCNIFASAVMRGDASEGYF